MSRAALALVAALALAGCEPGDDPTALPTAPVLGGAIDGSPADDAAGAAAASSRRRLIRKPASAASSRAASSAAGGPPRLTFAQLSDFEVVPAELGGDPAAAMPDALRAMLGKRVVIRGHMVVMERSGKRVTKFVLARYKNGCCGFGTVPKPNEWVIVRCQPAAATHQKLDVTGRLQLSEEVDRAGVPISIYRLDAESIVEREHE